jgi:hypothetical protein
VPVPGCHVRPSRTWGEQLDGPFAPIEAATTLNRVTSIRATATIPTSVLSFHAIFVHPQVMDGLGIYLWTIRYHRRLRHGAAPGRADFDGGHGKYRAVVVAP